MESNFYILTSKAKIAAYSHHISIKNIILGYTLLILGTVKKDLCKFQAKYFFQKRCVFALKKEYSQDSQL